MSQPARRIEKTVETVIKRVETFDDDTLWMFVCRLFPDASREFLEDAFDIITVSRARLEPSRQLKEVLRDLDRRHGIAR